jgi:hypothetical protein
MSTAVVKSDRRCTLGAEVRVKLETIGAEIDKIINKKNHNFL